MAGDKDEQYLLAVLMILTLCSGLIDAVCYLGLGHVFTANMTGNVVVVGFALAGAPGFSVTATLTSLFVFLIGALCGGRIALRVARRSQLLFIAIAIEAVFVGAAAVIAATAVTVATGWGRYAAIAILAFAMGIRNSVIRRLAVPGINTTVLTMTLTGIAADSILAGGTSPKLGRQTTAVLAMLLGALISAALYLHLGPGLPLAISAGCAAVAAVTLRGSGAARDLDKEAMKAT